MNSIDLNRKINLTARMVDNYLIDFYNKNEGEIWNAAFHYINAGGKRLRPFILIKCYELLTEKNNLEAVLPVASAIETFHTFSLIHDDIMDGDNKRRGVDSVHTRWGNSMAILSGDLLFGLCNFLVNMSDLEDSIKNKILTEFAQVSIDVCQGQASDIIFEQKKDVTEDEYIKMISLKTGALFEKSAVIGGLAAGADEEHVMQLREFGSKLGISFQIIDDLLGLLAEEKELGKPVSSDLHKGKKTYIIINAYENLGKSDADHLMEILSLEEKTDSNIRTAYALIKKSGALQRAQMLAEKYRNEALNFLNKFEDCEAKNDLYQITSLVIDRKK